MDQRLIPDYFEEIRAKAAQRWDQLEADEELAGPWWQLFRQIQSPRHVLSELLQNADDAGARSANAWIEDGVFIFEHDGEDFIEEQFASLCRFGFSNKRHLHTIGFRGIGFKSTFSLGDTVELVTPTLSVRFSKRRFTEPVWVEDAPITQRTRISVRLNKAQVITGIQKSLDEWANSTLSLLFFQSIRSLTVCDKEITRTVIGEGPVEGSEQIRLVGEGEQEILRIVSPLEEFPPEALEEIRQERMTVDPDFSLPPCSIEIVVGVSGPQRLYVVLPTDRQTGMPFSINAPFVQDPARRGIKEPSISPTNRWLLERAGQLAAKSMGEWLAREECDQSKRAEAYQLLPSHPEKSDESDFCICSVISKYLEGHPILLTSNGSLVERCFVPPYVFYDIWNPEDIAAFAGSEYDAILSQTVLPDFRKRLERWGCIVVHNNKVIVEWFKTHIVPRPVDYDQILLLWTYVVEYLPYRWYPFGSLNILPVEGSARLFPAETIVRAGDLILGLSAADTGFLSAYLHFFDRSFLRIAVERLKDPESKEHQIVYEILSRTKLEKDSTAKVLVEQAYSQLSPKYDTEKLIRFAHIAGFLDADIPKGFLYVTCDGGFHPVTDDLALDAQCDLEEILPENYRMAHLLHDDYLAGLDPGKRRQWIKWTESTKSGLKLFVGIEEQAKSIYSKKELLKVLQVRGGRVPVEYPIRQERFLFTDYDVHPDIVAHIERHCAELHEDKKSLIWIRVFELIASDPGRSWKNQLQATCYQQGYSKDHILSCGVLPASWVKRFANTKCIYDTDGIPHEPNELLLRNAKTEALMGVEPFVNRRYDTEELHDLLIALGVRETPGNPDAIIDRIRGFSGHEKPPEYELVKLYERLDGLLKHCSHLELITSRRMFDESRLIYTQEGVWAYPHEVFRTIPSGTMEGIFRVLPALRDLSLWSRIGVEHEPTTDILVKQLDSLMSGVRVESGDRNRIRMILSRAPLRVWKETEHWLSLDSVWKPVSAFSYHLASSVVGGVDSLFPHVRGATADLRMIDYRDINALISDWDLEDLQSAISLRVSSVVECEVPQKPRQWMVTLGRHLEHVRHENPEEEALIREIGSRLSETVWRTVSKLEVMPYLKGSPAGREQTPQVFWDDHILYVRNMSPGLILKVVPSEIRKVCSIQAVGEAIVHCYDRDPEVVTEYCKANFTLLPEGEVITTEQAPVSSQNDRVPYPEARIVHITKEAETSLTVDKQEDLPLDDTCSETELILGSSEPDGHQGSNADEETMHTLPPRSTDDNKQPQRRCSSLHEIFAEKFHYYRDPANGRYVSSNGSWIEKAERPFHWEIHSPDGEVIGRLWENDSNLSKGVEVPAEVWGMIERQPDRSVILLRSEDDGIDVIPGTALLAQLEHEELRLFPAKYRLRRVTG